MADVATVEVQMPAMGESVTEGTVLEWHVSEGQAVSEGDTVVEVSTDKIDAEVPAPASGVITKLLVDVDDRASPPAGPARVTRTSAAARTRPSTTRRPRRPRKTGRTEPRPPLATLSSWRCPRWASR